MRKHLIVVIAFALCAILLRLSPNAEAQNQFRIDPAPGGSSSAYLRVMPTYSDARVLAANTNEDHTVPTGSRWVVFSANCSEWYAKRGGTATVPAADVTDGTASSMNPSGFDINGVSTIGLKAPAACTITLDFYK